MGVNVQASGRGGVSLGGKLDLGSLGGATSPATVSAALFVVLLVLVVVVAMSAR